MHDLVIDLMEIGHQVSRIAPERSGKDVYLAFLAEFGEFAEEVNIHRGYIKKPQGADGIVGEAADVSNCIADLVWVAGRSLTEEGFSEAMRLLSDVASVPDFTGQVDCSFDAAFDCYLDHASDFRMFYDLASLDTSIEEPKPFGDAGVMGPAHILAVGHFLNSVLLLAKVSNLHISEESFLTIYSAKCQKWRKAALNKVAAE
jgi:hypothetical protein